MSNFDAAAFMSEPSKEALLKLRKEDLIALTNFLNIEIKRSSSKSEIQRTILQFLNFESTTTVDTDNDDVQNYDENLEMMRLKLEMKKLDIENERSKRELENERSKREHELALKKLEFQLMNSENNSSHDAFDLTKHIRFVPIFDEADVDKFFLHFEKVAISMKWPEESWVMLLQTALRGKAREIYTQLSIDEAQYYLVKRLILNAYELVPEAYRQKFRNLTKKKEETFQEFAKNKELLLNRWLSSQEVGTDFEKLKQLIIIEEFKNRIPADVRTYIEEQRVDDIQVAARLADEHSLIHKTSSCYKPGDELKPQQVSRPVHEENRQPSTLKKRCFYCKREGHVASKCFKLQHKNQNMRNFHDHKANGFVTSAERAQNSSNVDDTLNFEFSPQSGGKVHNVVRYPSMDVFEPDNGGKVHNVVHDPSMDVFEPFIYDGLVSLNEDMSDATHVRILRDTGASQSLVLASILPFSSNSSAGSTVLIKGINCSEYMPVPLHVIQLKSNILSGRFQIGVTDLLPFTGIAILLGNDLAGGKVFPNPILTEKPSLESVVTPIDSLADPYPSCAVTRSMSFRQENASHIEDDSDVDINLSETFMAHDHTPALQNIPKEFQSEKANIIAGQKNDPEIISLSESAVSEEEASLSPSCYFLRNGILMRKWRPLDVPATHEWEVKYQIVVPKAFRLEILKLAHEIPLSGHLGVNKTYRKILNHFYWPRMRRDVAQFCQTCHSCQTVGKPNQSVPKAPLKPIPAFEEPFSRVLIDCVGPLPKTKSGNQYLLTMMCASSRFPEAIPLRNIKSKTIVKALIKVFTTYGLPKSIQTDQGSNFMSGLFQQVMQELGIKKYNSSAYHPESQGALERWHQTLKNMIRTYCHETEKDWDEGIHLLLFAARDTIQESLGFSPFDLVFGHVVRGPLKCLKETILSETADDSPKHCLQYVIDFRTKLMKAWELARTSLKSVQKDMKDRFDLKAVRRNFDVGQKVLALLPVQNNPLQARYVGPYVIQNKISEVNYVLSTPDRRKKTQLCHINMLKAYFDRSEITPREQVSVNAVCSYSDNNNLKEESNIFDVTCSAKLTNSETLQNLDDKLKHLDSNKKENLKLVINKYEHLFSDSPTQTNVLFHDVDVGDASPIKQHPYRVNPIKQQYLEKEITYLLENGLIEPSKSNWSSPCILVPKPDGSYRLCTDYRKVNNVTKSDSFPIPRMEDCVDKVGNAQYVTKFDLLKGFWQVPLTDRAKEISAFVVPSGLYQYKVMPFGMKNSPATFQRMMNQVIADIENCEVYIDDIVIYSVDWQVHIKTIEKLFDRLSEANLTINLAKSEFGCAHLTYLGHVVGQGRVRPVHAKVEAVANFPTPEDKKQLMRFLGMAGYYRKFCPNFSAIAEPLTCILSKRIPFTWNSACDSAFQKLKAILLNDPVLAAPNFSCPFKLAVDASDLAVGGVLLQDDAMGIEHPVSYFSKKLLKNQRNYSTIEKECLSIILAVQHFEVYLSCSSPIVIYSDHSPLVFLNKMKTKNQRLLRWSLFLQSFDIEIKNIKGKDNVIADCLSRVNL